MECPACSGQTKVLDSRVAPGGSIRRRRECEACGERFTTYERAGAAFMHEPDARPARDEEATAA